MYVAVLISVNEIEQNWSFMADVEIVMLHFFFSNYDLQFSIGQNQNWIVNPFFHQEKCHKI